MLKKTVTVAAVLVLAFAFAPVFAGEDGKSLYSSKCAMCHGADGVAKPMAKGAQNFNDPAFKKGASEDGIVKIIHDGKGKMKGLGDKLTADQSKAVADYVLTLAK